MKLAGVRRVVIEPRYEAWREAARALLREGVCPDDVDLVDATEPLPALLFDPAQPEGDGQHRTGAHIRVPAEFVRRAEVVACHRERERWNLLYRLLWRLQSERGLLRMELDEDVARLRRMEHQVKYDLHKMHAFVRFRRGMDMDGEHFIAWYEPAHRVLGLAAPFFAERFAVMRWSILTPDGSVSWEPETKSLHFGAGVSRERAPEGDDLEEMWRTYYKSIFNPARTNITAMRSEMPVRYWKNLPEVMAMPEMLQQADARVGGMIAAQANASATAFVPQEHRLPVLQSALPACQGCDLYRCATQAVFGRGPATARLMLVGEQPGDEEDRRGEPFVGPAGRLLNELMIEAGVDREAVYVTNAVKHFKFREQGKRRLHENPRLSEIFACRPWLLAEMDAVKPKVVVCLGASAAKSLLGANFALTRNRGQVLASPYAERVIATFHPSAILRAEAERAAGYREMLVQDLRMAAEMAY
ncbi:UdgX family uracil-DNA binding protein [Acidobacteria bacterium AB60]|nr:UdgX family uracil-DNA binding protein [Acidobacteria bacterium AB60]